MGPDGSPLPRHISPVKFEEGVVGDAILAELYRDEESFSLQVLPEFTEQPEPLKTSFSSPGAKSGYIKEIAIWATFADFGPDIIYDDRPLFEAELLRNERIVIQAMEGIE